MASEAMRQLREWQRQRAGEQDQALRDAARAWTKLAELERQRVDAVEALADALGRLEASGIDRAQTAALLEVAENDLTAVASGPSPRADRQRGVRAKSSKATGGSAASREVGSPP